MRLLLFFLACDTEWQPSKGLSCAFARIVLLVLSDHSGAVKLKEDIWTLYVGSLNLNNSFF